MSPSVAVIVGGAVLGTAAFAWAAARRKVGCSLALAPFPLAIVVWLGLAGQAPPPRTACEDAFGPEVVRAAREITTGKPLLMDGFFLRFRVLPEAGAVFPPPGFTRRTEAPGALFAGTTRPREWPAGLEDAGELWFGSTDSLDVVAHWDAETGVVHAACHHRGW